MIAEYKKQQQHSVELVVFSKNLAELKSTNPSIYVLTRFFSSSFRVCCAGDGTRNKTKKLIGIEGKARHVFIRILLLFDTHAVRVLVYLILRLFCRLKEREKASENKVECVD